MKDPTGKEHMKDNIIKRGNSYAAAVYVGRDQDTGKKRYKWVSAPSRQEVKVKMADLKASFLNGTYTSPKGSLGEYLERWLRQYAKNLSPRTYEGYQSIYQSGLGPGLGSVPLRNLNPDRIQRYYADRLDAGLSTSTVRHHSMMLHKALEHAVEWQLLGKNPADAATPPPIHQREMQTFTGAEAVAFLKAAEKTPFFTEFHLALYTGMRRSEIMALRWQDVDLSLGQVYVTRTAHQLNRSVAEGKPRRIIFKGTKTKRSTRLIDLDAATVDVLRQHLETHKGHCARLGIPFSASTLLFCDFDTETSAWAPVPPDRVSNAWDRLRDRLGLRHVRFHDARHTHASLMLKDGAHMKVVQERLGHATIGTTMDIYSHVAAGMQRQAANSFGAMMASFTNDGLADGLADRGATTDRAGQEVEI